MLVHPASSHKSNHLGKVGIKAWVCPNTEHIEKVSLTPSSFTLFRYCGLTTLVCNKEHQFFSNILDFISLLCHSMKKCFENIFNEEKILVYLAFYYSSHEIENGECERKKNKMPPGETLLYLLKNEKKGN